MADILYCEVADVVGYTGVQPRDIGCADQTELEAKLTKWIYEAADLIKAYLNFDYESAGDVPRGVQRVCRSMVSDTVVSSTQVRKNPYLRIDDFAVKRVEEVNLDDKNREILKMYKRGTSVANLGLSVPRDTDYDTFWGGD